MHSDTKAVCDAAKGHERRVPGTALDGLKQTCRHVACLCRRFLCPGSLGSQAADILGDLLHHTPVGKAVIQRQPLLSPAPFRRHPLDGRGQARSVDTKLAARS